MKSVKLAYKRFETDAEYIERLKTINLPYAVKHFITQAFPAVVTTVWPGEAKYLTDMGYPRRLVWVDS